MNDAHTSSGRSGVPIVYPLGTWVIPHGPSRREQMIEAELRELERRRKRTGRERRREHLWTPVAD